MSNESKLYMKIEINPHEEEDGMREFEPPYDWEEFEYEDWNSFILDVIREDEHQTGVKANPLAPAMIFGIYRDAEFTDSIHEVELRPHLVV